jgi:hypothetical protein
MSTQLGLIRVSPAIKGGTAEYSLESIRTGLYHLGTTSGKQAD